MRTCTIRRASTAFALALATWLTACSGGGNGSEGDGGAVTPTEQPVVFRTLTAWAGSIDRGGAGDIDGNGTAARLGHPTRLAAASDGSLWVYEGQKERIRRIDAQGNVRTVLDVRQLPRQTTVDGHISFAGVQAMVAGPSGEIFVAVTQVTSYLSGAKEDMRWVVLRIAPDAAPTTVALPGPGTGVSDSVSALALDQQGRLYIGDRRCTIWRSDGEVLTTAQPRGAVLVHASDPASPGRNCGQESPRHEITRLALDGNDRVLFSLGSGDVRRIESDGRITTLGRTSLGSFCATMAVDRAGRLLLTGGSTVLMQLDASGKEQPVAGSAERRGWFDGPSASASFANLCGVAIDREGRIVLTDSDNHTVRRIAADGMVSTVAGLAPQVGYRDGTGTEALFGGSVGVGLDVNGNLLVADPHNGLMRRVDAQQRVSTLAGVHGEFATYPPADGPVATTPLYFPHKALMAGDGSLWIAEGSTLRVLGADGMIRTVEVGGQQAPLAMTLDSRGDVVVMWGGSLSIVGAGGRRSLYQHLDRYSVKAPHAAPQRLELAIPDDLWKRLFNAFITVRGLCLLPDGTFAYTQGHAVLRRAADGTVTELAGSADQPGDTDGPATTARFNSPAGLACDAAGSIYVADTGNHTVRHIDARRTVRTVLGTAGRAGHRTDTLPGELDSPHSLVLVPGGLIVNTGMGIVRAGF
jgi:hypothetical protein